LKGNKKIIINFEKLLTVKTYTNKPKPKKDVKACGKGKGCSWAGNTVMLPLNQPFAKAA